MITLLYHIFTKSFVVLLISMLSINYLPNKLFHDYPFEPRSVETNRYNSLVLEWNSKLTENTAEYIQLNQIKGPESMAISKAGLIYTGLADGRIVEIDPLNKYELRLVTKFNKNSKKCPDDYVLNSDECGRFLQMRFLNDTLYALETNHGLFKVDVTRGQLTPVGPKTHLSHNNLYNGFAFDPKESNIAYVTTSSTRWRLHQIIWSALELENSGQILGIDIVTGKRVVLVDNLMMPNGLDVDVKRDQIIYSETTNSRISSLSLSGARTAFKLSKDGDKQVKNLIPKVLVSTLPGSPDNIVVKNDIAYIAIPFIRLDGKEFQDLLSDKPTIRKAIGRLVFGFGKILQLIYENVYQHPKLETAYRELTSGHFLYYVIHKDKSGIIEYNLDTNSQRFLGSDHYGYISEAKPDSLGNIYLGSFTSNSIVKVKSPIK